MTVQLIFVNICQICYLYNNEIISYADSPFSVLLHYPEKMSGIVTSYKHVGKWQHWSQCVSLAMGEDSHPHKTSKMSRGLSSELQEFSSAHSSRSSSADYVREEFDSTPVPADSGSFRVGLAVAEIHPTSR